MGSVVVGIAIIGLALFKLQRQRVPQGGKRIQGTVVEELSQSSKVVGRRTLIYAPKARYLDPNTGEERIYTAGDYSQDRYRVGEEVTLIYNPEKNGVKHAYPQPIKDTVGLVLAGLFFIAFPFVRDFLPW